MPIGSISTGTMRSEYLVPAFYDALLGVDKKCALGIKREYAKAFRTLDGISVRNYTDDQFEEDMSFLVNETLYYALNDHCMDYCYFGSSEGDGCDYGVWVDMESLESDIREGCVYQFDDLSGIDEIVKDDGIVPKRVFIVNDHGNMSLYDISVSLVDCENSIQVVVCPKEVWSIV